MQQRRKRTFHKRYMREQHVQRAAYGIPAMRQRHNFYRRNDYNGYVPWYTQYQFWDCLAVRMGAGVQ